MSLVLLYIIQQPFDHKDPIYFPWLRFLTISKYSFLLFEPIQLWCGYFDAGKFKYRKKKSTK